ncbi:MAG TPA: SRPBCC domain-containing protein [Cytophagaceae bacterium]|jgi:uncharacterized protein YndB with AHSA1/START domain|nr:SRPBCC domain-containing protein [Cytophagaceae bacterium]
MPKQEFKIVREFKAPRDIVFDAFAEAEALAQWWGPTGMSLSIVKLNFKPQGYFHYKMEGNDAVMWGVFKYGEIRRPDLIEFINSFSDEKGNICRAPFSPVWPLEIYNKLTLTEHNGTTTLTLAGYPINSTEEEDKMYYSFMDNMQQGFKGTFDQLDAYLSKIQQ